MIAKIGRGHDIIRLVRYLFSPGRHNEHTDQRVIAAADSLDPVCGVPLDWEEVSDLARRCDAPHADFGIEPAKGHVWHVSLSNPKDDRVLSDSEWAEIARQTMTAMGFTEDGKRAGCRWVAVAHGTSVAGNEHIHIAVSLVREDGTVASIWRDRITMGKVCGELEATYGLTATHVVPGVGLPGVTRAELERAAREGRAEPDRPRLARLVRAAAVASETEAEFVRRLRRGGVLVRPRYAEGGRARVVGYSAALRPEGAADPIWFGGGRLARDLALPRLRERWEAGPGDQQAALLEWTGHRSTANGRETQVGALESWQMAADAVQDAWTRLAAVPVDDVAAWTGAAGELAGVFAAASARLEGPTPGPLARAAHLLARSAQTATRLAPSPRRPGRNLRGVATIAAQARQGENSEKAWATLLTQMRGTTLLIARLHMARGERFHATRLAELATGDLAALCVRLAGGVEGTPATGTRGWDRQVVGPSANARSSPTEMER